MRKLNPPQEALLPIREVAKITGINPITLRAWERRYSLIEPVRTESGHRLYTHENIKTLKEVIRLTQQGVPISQIKSLLDQPKAPAIEPQTESSLEPLLIESLEKADIQAFNQLLDNIMADYTMEFWQPLFSRTTLSLTENTTASQLWYSLMVPRLQSRLHLSYRQLSTDLRPIWVQCSENTHSLLGILAALNLVSQGYMPLLQPNRAVHFEQLVPSLQTLHCHGVAWVNATPSPALDDWRAWTQEHPSFELFLFLNQPDMNAFGQMQVQLFDLTTFESASLPF